jgi:hypothetical protein
MTENTETGAGGGAGAHEVLVLEVECYAGYRGEESPVRFRLGGRWLEVEEIVDRWLAPTHRYFKVRARGGGVYILRHATDQQRWELTLYDSDSRPGGRLSSS